MAYTDVYYVIFHKHQSEHPFNYTTLQTDLDAMQPLLYINKHYGKSAA